MKILSNKILPLNRYEELQKVEAAYEKNKKRLSDYETLATLHLNIAKIIGDIEEWDNIDDSINKITQQIFDVFKFEYVCVGRCLIKELKDYKPITTYQVAIPKDLESSPIENSFIGQIVQEYDSSNIFKWTTEDGDITDINKAKNKIPNIQPKHIDRFKRYFKFTSVKDFYVIPLKRNENEIIGYIILCNRNEQDRLTYMEEESLKALSSHISRCIDRHLFFRYNHYDTKKIREIHGLDYESGVKEILKYLYDEFSLLLAVFWIPIIEDDQRCFVMKHCHHNFLGSKKNAIETVRFRNGKDSIKTIAADKRKVINWFRNLNKEELGFSIDIGTDQAIVVLIYDKDIENNDELLGVFTLYPPKQFKKSVVINERIEMLSSDIGHYLQATLFNRHYQQVEKLRDQLLTVDFNNPNNFYKEIVALINNTLQSEYCSLFFADENDELYLKATNSDKFTHLDKKTLKKKSTFLTSDYINKKNRIIYKRDCASATYRVFKDEKTINIYNIYSESSKTETHFCEISPHTHEPMIAAPISYQDKVRGVVRCLNKKREDNILPAFDKLDIEMLDFLARIVSKFIENAEKDKDKYDFVNHLAHEIRTPVQIIWNDMYSMKRRIKRFADHKEYDAINNTFKRLRLQTEIINNNYNNLEAVVADKHSNIYRFEKTNLKTHIRDIVELLQPKLKEYEDKPITVDVYINQMPKELYVDNKRMYQVFYNVISNAARYSTYDSRIKIVYNDDVEVIINNKIAKCIEIAISNYGIGIKSDELELIFNQYYRSPTAKSKDATGKGIGLFVAQNIVKRHGGVIQVTNLNEPTTFSILLPNKLKSEPPKKP